MSASAVAGRTIRNRAARVGGPEAAPERVLDERSRRCSPRAFRRNDLPEFLGASTLDRPLPFIIDLCVDGERVDELMDIDRLVDHGPDELSDLTLHPARNARWR